MRVRRLVAMIDYTAEKAALAEVLDVHRRMIVWKVEGLSREEASKPMVPSGTSLLGVVKHLAYVERRWFQDVLAGQNVDFPWTEDDPDADWRIEDDDTVEGVIALYDAECDISKQVLADLESLDAIFTYGSRSRSARRILLHMVEEIARHVGHMDIMREQFDGTTGYWPDDD